MKRKEGQIMPLNGLLSLAKQNTEDKDGILIVHAEKSSGSDLAASILYEITDPGTILFLSGGKTPIPLYTRLAAEGRLKIGSAGMIDERFGKPMHKNSNELMISKTGLINYFHSENIPFYPILKDDLSIDISAGYYDRKARYWFSHFVRSAAILGIGEDGHIAGIAPNRSDFINPLFSPERSQTLVSYFIDPLSIAKTENSSPSQGFGKRITMTFKGLARIDVLIVLAFGGKKLEAITRLFGDGPVEEIPARFFKEKTVAKKTILITDQLKG